MSTYTVVIADDHPMFRVGIRSILEGASDIKVIGEAGDGLELIKMIRKLGPDIVLLDISMPHLRGIEAIREIKAVRPETKLLILTMHKRKEYLYHAISSGAEGYLLKEDVIDELFVAINKIRQGRTYMSPLLHDEMAEVITYMRPNGGHLVAEPLTDREREIIGMIAEGKSSKEIAKLLFISFRTVQHHRANIRRKLNVKGTADLVRYAIREGLPA